MLRECEHRQMRVVKSFYLIGRACRASRGACLCCLQPWFTAFGYFEFFFWSPTRLFRGRLTNTLEKHFSSVELSQGLTFDHLTGSHFPDISFVSFQRMNQLFSRYHLHFRL